MATLTPILSSLSPPQWILQWSEIVAGVGSIILTVMLVMLYKRQQEQLAAQHEAVLGVTDVDWDGDKATVRISNFGNGVAKQLRLTTLVLTDTGDHRKNTIRSNFMKRTEQTGERPNAIRPGEEDVKFEGRSRVGIPAPKTFERDWVGRNFSDFMRDLKSNNCNDVKYLHVINADQLSKKVVSEPLHFSIRKVNPQDFDRHHSLSNLPRLTEYGHNQEFERYFRSTIGDWWKDRIYIGTVRLINWILPKFSVRVRPLDTSGKRRVKRVLLRRDIAYFYQKLRKEIL